MTKTTKIPNTCRPRMSLQQLITDYFSDGKRDTCTGVIKHIAAMGYQAKSASATLCKLLESGVLVRTGSRGNYRYQISPVQPKGETLQVEMIISRPKDPEMFAVERFHKVNRILESTRRRASV